MRTKTAKYISVVITLVLMFNALNRNTCFFEMGRKAVSTTLDCQKSVICLFAFASLPVRIVDSLVRRTMEGRRSAAPAGKKGSRGKAAAAADASAVNLKKNHPEKNTGFFTERVRTAGTVYSLLPGPRFSLKAAEVRQSSKTAVSFLFLLIMIFFLPRKNTEEENITIQTCRAI